MAHSEITHQALIKIFPKECSIAGKDNVINISNGTKEVMSLPGGSNFDISAILNILVNASSLIANAITMILFYRELNKKPPTPEQVEIHITNNIIIESDISKEKRLALYQFLLENLDQINPPEDE